MRKIFFEINDIEINGNKLELIVISHKKVIKSELMVRMEKNQAEVIAKSPKESVRFLGVWIRSAPGYSYMIELIKKEIDIIVTVLNKKKIIPA